MTFNIRHQFLVYTLGIVLAVGTAVAVQTIRDSQIREFRGFGEEAKTVTNMLAGSLVNDLYFFDLQSATQKLDIVSVNPSIVAAYVLDTKGATLIASGVDKNGERRSGPPADLVATLLQTTSSIAKTEDQAVYTGMPIAMSDGSVLGFIVVTYSLDNVYEELEEIVASIAMTTGLAIIMAGVLALVAGWYFARPIIAIKDAALAVSKGGLHIRSTVKRNDEIGLLGNAINAMADGLINRLNELELTQLELAAAKHYTEEANQQIRLLNEDLELRVAERTAELREAQHSLVRKERLSALGQLTATVAHELRNPLSVIQNTLFIMKETVASKGVTLDKPIARMERSIGRCNRIISDLLDYSRQRDLQHSERQLDDWLVGLLAELPPPVNISIGHDLQAGRTVARFDADRLRRVVINLIDNAAQALSEKPPVGASPHIMVVTRLTGDGIELCVRDNGPGIPPDMLPKIFEPLFSTRSFGTGLGLPTVKQIVEQHGGQVDVTSDVGIGTQVRVWLPILAVRNAA